MSPSLARLGAIFGFELFLRLFLFTRNALLIGSHFIFAGSDGDRLGRGGAADRQYCQAKAAGRKKLTHSYPLNNSVIAADTMLALADSSAPSKHEIAARFEGSFGRQQPHAFISLR